MFGISAFLQNGTAIKYERESFKNTMESFKNKMEECEAAILARYIAEDEAKKAKANSTPVQPNTNFYATGQVQPNLTGANNTVATPSTVPNTVISITPISDIISNLNSNPDVVYIENNTPMQNNNMQPEAFSELDLSDSQDGINNMPNILNNINNIPSLDSNI